MKNRPENKIDELFSEAFRGYSPAPPGTVLDRIKNTVANDSRNKPKSFWIKYRMFFTIAAGIILISGVSSAYFLSMDSQVSSNKQVALNNNEGSQVDPTADQNNELSGINNQSKSHEVADETNNTQTVKNQINNNSSAKESAQEKALQNSSEKLNVANNQANANNDKSEKNNTDKSDLIANNQTEKNNPANKDLNANNQTAKTVKTGVENNENVASAEKTNNDLSGTVKNNPADNTIENKTDNKTVNNKNAAISDNGNNAVNDLNKSNDQQVVAVNGLESKVTNNNSDAKLTDHSNDDVSHNYNDYAKNYDSENKPVKLRAETMKDSITGPSIDLPVPTKAGYTPSKFAIGVHYTSENLFHLTDAKYLPDQTFNMTGNSYEISLNFRITPKITLSTGIGYTEYRENVYYDVVHDKQVIVDSVYSGSEYIYVYETQTMTYEEQMRNSYSFVRLPLSIRYKLFEANRFSLHGSVGGIFSQIMNKREREPVIPDGINLVSVTRKTPEQSTYTIMFATGLNAHYKLSDFLTLGADVLYKTNMSTYYKDNGTEMKVPYSIGFRVGLYANF